MRRHRQRARYEDRIKDAKDTGLTNLPYADAASNAIWIHVVLLAMNLTTWAQQLALTGTWRVDQPKTLRLKLLATAARYVNAARRRIIDLDPDEIVGLSGPRHDSPGRRTGHRERHRCTLDRHPAEW